MSTKQSILAPYTLFREWLDEIGEADLVKSSGIYSQALVIWLMIFQRLKEGASLLRACDELDASLLEDLGCKGKRVREGRVSKSTGGYSQARRELSVDVVKGVTDELYSWLREQPTVTN